MALECCKTVDLCSVIHNQHYNAQLTLTKSLSVASRLNRHRCLLLRHAMTIERRMQLLFCNIKVPMGIASYFDGHADGQPVLESARRTSVCSTEHDADHFSTLIKQKGIPMESKFTTMCRRSRRRAEAIMRLDHRHDAGGGCQEKLQEV